MQEIIVAAFSPVNVVLTVLLILVVLYWLMVIFGAMDLDFLDIDFDNDVDMDFDADAEIDGDAGFLRGVLEFFYIGEVPVMILFSILILSMWAVSMIVNHVLNPAGSVLLGLPIFCVNLVVSIMICRVFAMPFRKVFSALNKDVNASGDVMGRICIVTTTQVSKKMGQAEMPSRGAPVLLNVMAEGDNVLNKGDEAVVIGRNSEDGVYIIAPVDLEK